MISSSTITEFFDSIVPLGVIEEHCTTVYKVQEAFSAVSLPEGNVYGNAIRKCLYGK